MPFIICALDVHGLVRIVGGMDRSRTLTVLATLLLISVSLSAGAILAGWSVCFGGFSADCASTTWLESHWVLPSLTWIVSLVAATSALFIAPRKIHILAAVGILLVINPLTDAGAFFIAWDTADTLPFTGLWISAAAITAATLLLMAASPRVITPLAEKPHDVPASQSVAP